MTKTISFAKLDFLTMKSYLTIKNIFIVLFFSAFASFMSGNGSFTIGFLMMYATIYASSIFAIIDKNSMDTLYLSLPITRWNIVAGRYLFALSFQFITGICAVIFACIAMLLGGKSFSLIQLLLTAVICFGLYGFITACQLPILFKLKYTSAKGWVFLPVAVIPLITVMLTSFVGKEQLMVFILPILTWFQENMSITVIAVICIWMTGILFSIYLSHRFYQKRTF